ncbi:unnamed protein product [Rhizophagus irregularis]|nr:unnamed protein product [Rhizophagus irregularis]
MQNVFESNNMRGNDYRLIVQTYKNNQRALDYFSRRKNDRKNKRAIYKFSQSLGNNIWYVINKKSIH